MNEQWIGICPNGLAPGVTNKCFLHTCSVKVFTIIDLQRFDKVFF